MITYKAIFKLVEGGVHAEVADFPGVISCGGTFDAARDNLETALVDLAETLLLSGEPLPQPQPEMAFHEEVDLEEPIYLLLQAASHQGAALATFEKASGRLPDVVLLGPDDT